MYTCFSMLCIQFYMLTTTNRQSFRTIMKEFHPLLTEKMWDFKQGLGGGIRFFLPSLTQGHWFSTTRENMDRPLPFFGEEAIPLWRLWTIEAGTLRSVPKYLQRKAYREGFDVHDLVNKYTEGTTERTCWHTWSPAFRKNLTTEAVICFVSLHFLQHFGTPVLTWFHFYFWRQTGRWQLAIIFLSPYSFPFFTGLLTRDATSCFMLALWWYGVIAKESFKVYSCVLYFDRTDGNYKPSIMTFTHSAALYS